MENTFLQKKKKLLKESAAENLKNVFWSMRQRQHTFPVVMPQEFDLNLKKANF